MPLLRTVLISVPALGAAFITYEHLRLARLYPTLPAPPELLPRGEGWERCHVADSWEATIPRRFLCPRTISPAASIAGTPVLDDEASVFSQAFWTTWPLRLEGKMLDMVNSWSKGRDVVGFAKDPRVRKGKAEAAFEPGLLLMNNGFLVREHTRPNLGATSTGKMRILSGPVVFEWGALQNPTGPLGRTFEMAGGYHSLAVVENDSVGQSGAAETVKVVFTSLLTYAGKSAQAVEAESDGAAGEGLPSQASKAGNLGVAARALGWFHQEYSRILLDLAVKKLHSS